jgi:hypothetical protein
METLAIVAACVILGLVILAIAFVVLVVVAAGMAVLPDNIIINKLAGRQRK